MNDPIIRTKLRLPLTRQELVPRPRLLAQIALGLRGPLTLITAPAGFGKTTLVASSITQCGWPVAWLSLDKNDNQAGRFLNYLIAALQIADVRLGDEAAQLMVNLQQASAEAVLTSLINDLDTANAEIVLVLDDYHLINSQAVHDAVVFLLEHCPKIFHLVIATRSDPPLPLSRLRARAQTVELRAADLRFTPTEAGQFLNEVMGLQLEPAAVAALEARTEGWIAGLQMAAISMRDRKDVSKFVESFSGTNRYILDYLLEEVLAHQPPPTQRFLFYTSILERLSAPLCDAILAIDAEQETAGDSGASSTQQLDYLERENLFLVALDDDRTWFRYHHLFADLLKARLQLAQPNLVPQLHIKAANWFEQNGLIPEAIQHLLLANEIGRAADMIEQYGPARLAESDPAVLQMADGLPEEIIIERPKIGLYQAWFLILHSRIAKARPLLAELAQQLETLDPKSRPRWMTTFIDTALGFLAPPAGPSGGVLLPDIRLLDEIPEGEVILRNAADFLYGMALARRGEITRAVEVALNCIQREKLKRGTTGIPTLAPFLTRLYLMDGKLSATAVLCREFLDPIKEKGIRFVYTSGSMMIDLGEVLSERNFLNEAEGYIREGLRSNEPWQNIMTDGFGLVALVRVLLAKGDYAGAMAVVDTFETKLLQYSHPREFDEALHTLRIRVELASGNLEKGIQWADQIERNEDFELYKDQYCLVLARIRLAQGKYSEVEKILAGMTLESTNSSRISRQLECNLLLAAAQAGQQRVKEAFGLVEASLALAEPEGYVRVFLDTGDPTRELLAAYLRLPDPAQKIFAQKILGAFLAGRGRNASVQPTERLMEALSGRELEVLQLIASGCTNQEIARQLIVAAGTVKAHAASIYRKLDAANRTEAVARARQLGILT